jgi:hypothetical protein
MREFRTLVNTPVSEQKISLHQPLLTMGSCFADVIGAFLVNHKFTVLTNPFGTTYNPHSIHQHILASLRHEEFPAHTYLTNQDLHLNYHFHSSISALNQQVVKGIITERLRDVGQFLSRARWLIITYGTAWGYYRNDTGELVANCHKMPGHLFTKELLTQKKILESFDTMHQALVTRNPEIQIILTVSPVRHVKDTLPLNSVSKSVLRLVCHTLQEQYSNVHYFPAYEIMMDDLRDYRFYISDMIHPNEDAEHYILDKFCSGFMDTGTREFIQTWTGIRKAMNHKPFHPGSAQHQQFLRDLITKLESLKQHVYVDEEIKFVIGQLNPSY